MTVVEGLEREAKRLTSADHFDSVNITARQVCTATMLMYVLFLQKR